MAACPRADCSAKHKELEVLRLDVAELQLENDKLHEHTASLRQQVETLQTMNDDLTEQLQTQRIVPDAVDTNDESNSRDMIHALNVKLNEALKREQSLMDKMRQIELERQKEKDRPTPDDVDESTMMPTVVKTSKEFMQLKKEEKERQDELYHALRDNEALREDNMELRAAVEKLSSVAMDVEDKWQKSEAAKALVQESLDDRTSAFEALMAKMEEQEREKDALEAKLLEMDDSEAHVDRMIVEYKNAFEQERRQLMAEIAEWKQRVQDLEVRERRLLVMLCRMVISTTKKETVATKY
jgi:predicted  nucleic acid-binding Zn-ribbon protein